ncbi:MAG TPA: ABC transporter permease [Acidobacteriota bacterium]|nr:ABC transporter permease [Acidobacteriota bacterium]
MLNVLHSFRCAFRFLWNSPGFSLVAILTLALGVGANTAVFSLINSVLLRLLPYEEPDRLVLVWESSPFFGVQDSPVAPGNYQEWKARSRSFEEIGALEDHSFRLTGEGVPEVIDGSFVTASLFRVLRTRPALGRLFTEEEDQPGGPKVTIISDHLWRRRFNSNPDIVGKTIRLDDAGHTVIGVLAPGTEPPAEYSEQLREVFAPFGTAYSAEQLAEKGRHNWMVIARLRPQVTLAHADAEMRAIGASLSREYPGTNSEVGAFVAPLRDHFVRSRQSILFILLGTVGLVLLIACLNLANLLLARASKRSKEVAVRTALGAGAWQLMRQFLCESLMLCAMGGALGLLLATSAFEFLSHLAPGAITGFKSLTLDWRVLTFTLAITGLTAIVFGLVPLIQFRRLDVAYSLKQGVRTLGAVAGSRRLRALLVCSEVALAFVLLVGAGLLLQTFVRLREVDLGCRTENVLTLRMPASDKQRGPGRSAAYQAEILRKIHAIPGVVSAGFTNHIPLLVKGDITGLGAEGHAPDKRFQCRVRLAGPGYLRTMGIPIVRGRDIDERDVEGAPLVVVVNETLANMIWPNQDPIGRRLFFPEPSAVVVGVTGDVHQAGLDVPPQPEFYISSLQAPYPPTSLAIHTRVDPTSLAPAVRQAIWSVDPDQPITAVASMEEIVERELFQRRLQTTLLGAFAGLALILAALGLYGVLAYLVGQQVPEIGMRIALGAAPRQILGRFVGQGLKLAIIGLGFGIAAATAVSRLFSAVLYGVTPTDPMVYGVVALVLLITAIIACYLPARRAMRVDPLVALREE